jgi:D-amino-acid oxidase
MKHRKENCYCAHNVQIAVVGAGVIGLCTALTIMESLNAHVTLMADHFPDSMHGEPLLVSQVAAASFIPHSILPDDREMKWLRVSAKRYMELSHVDGSGVKLVPGVEYFRQKTEFDPLWKDLVIDFRHEAPVGYYSEKYKDSWRYTTPIIDSSVYLKYLIKQLQSYKKQIQFEKLEEKMDDLSVLYHKYDIVINCTGLGAAGLKQCQEDAFNLRRSYGLVLRVDAPFVQHWARSDDNENDKITHVYPRVTDCILGGFKRLLAPDEQSIKEANPNDIQDILNRCCDIMPELNQKPVQILEILQGERPYRMSGIRLEAVQINNVESSGRNILLIHNYGHAGQGYCLSYGCAEEVIQMIKKYLQLNK